MGYFGNIARSAATIFEGLTITASHLFRKPITVQYPDRTEVPVKDMMNVRYRGFLHVDMKICTGCTLCQSACPIQCVQIGVAKNAEGKRAISKFDIDLGKCMFCGLCTEVCPTQAISFTREFERASENLNDLTFHFVKDGELIEPYKKGSGA